MAAVLFPDPPITVGQQFTATNGVTYQWDGGAWVSVPATSYPPSGAAGGDLAGSTYPNPVIKPLAVTNAKVNDVAWGKITGSPTSFPPSGAAGGDLTGSYPNPTMRANYTAPPSGPAGGDLAGSTYPNPVVVAGAITVAKLATAATLNAVASGAVTPNFTTTAANTWQTVATCPTLTTRGGYILICAAAALSYSVVTNGGNIAQLRVLRGAAQSALWRWDVGAGTVGALIPLPAHTYLEAAVAGAYVYVLQVNSFNANGNIISASQAGATGQLLVAELA
jgi:hypothetical protein